MCLCYLCACLDLSLCVCERACVVRLHILLVFVFFIIFLQKGNGSGTRTDDFRVTWIGLLTPKLSGRPGVHQIGFDVNFNFHLIDPETRTVTCFAYRKTQTVTGKD